MKARIIDTHPKITPERLAAARAARERLNGPEKPAITAKGREAFAQHERVRALIAQIKAARLAQNMTLDQVAQATGINVPNLSRLENDQEPDPRISTLLRVADVVGFALLPKGPAVT